MSEKNRAGIEEFTRSFTSKVKAGIAHKDLLKFLNLDLGSMHVYLVKGELEKDAEKAEGEEFNYMVNGIGLYACANKEVEEQFSELKYGDYVKVTLAPNSLIVLDISKL